jgi:prepilin-type N-terminal cleavage/methylation domain-containing protein
MENKKSRPSTCKIFSPGKYFTLIELLIVIAIIAILASMMLPALSRSHKVAKQTQCMGNYKQFGSAMTMYLDDYGWLPPAYNSVTLTSATAYSFKWGDQIESYLSSRQVSSGYFSEIKINYRSKWACTGQEYGDFLPGVSRVASVGYNCYIWMSPKLRFAKIANPSKFMLLGDAACDVLGVGTQIAGSPVSGGHNYFSFPHARNSVLLHGDMHVSTYNYVQNRNFVNWVNDPNYYFWIP